MNQRLHRHDSRLHVNATCIRDASGRQVILNGINLYGHPWGGFSPSSDDFRTIRDWGFTCVRLVMFWSRLEPQPGAYDEAAFAEIDTCITLAERLGLMVILDLHQDLWGGPIPGSRGAPDWTILNPALPHKADGPVWSTAYFEIPLVQSAFDDFWRNAAASDGMGLRDHFALLWGRIAARYADSSTVIGYDLLNEPAHGSAVQPGIVAATLAMRRRIDPAAWDGASDFERGLLAIEAARTSPEAFREMLAAGEPLLAACDHALLQPALQSAAEAIRQVDRAHFIATCPCITANLGFLPGLEPLLTTSGERDPNQVFAPHIYADDPDQIAIITRRLLDRAAKMNVPLVLGEWGNIDNSDGIFASDPQEATRQMLAQLEDAGISTMYWAYDRTLDRQPFFAEFLQRPRLRTVGGTLHDCTVEPDRFRCSWEESPAITAPTEVILPARWASQPTVSLSGATPGFTRTILPGGHILLSIPPINTSMRTLEVVAS